MERQTSGNVLVPWGRYHGETPPVWWFDGENLARDGRVVVVTVRHRVGALGFLHLADFPGAVAYEDSGNIGMLDLVDALRWVRNNIERFGGDPHNVTIFGESGGAAKVSVLLAMPEAQGLFHKAIIQSGCQMRSPSRDEASPFHPVAAPIGSAVPLIVGTCATEATFLTCGIPQVFQLSRPLLTQLLSRFVGDDYESVLTQYESARPGATPSDLFFAVITDFMFRMKAIRLAEMKSEQNGAAVYMYMLNYRTDTLGGKFRSPHTLDIPLVFRHYDSAILGSAPERFFLSQQMSDAWSAFAHTGRPDHFLIPEWTPYETTRRSTMCFDVPPELISDPQRAERLAWADRTRRDVGSS